MEKVVVWFRRESEQLVTLVKTPEKFYKTQLEETNLKKARRFYIFILGVKIVVTFCEVILLSFSDLNALFLISIVVSSVIIFGLGYLGAGGLHLFAKLVGGKGDYKSSFQIYVYGSAPGLLIGRLPILGMVGYLYGIYLTFLAIQILHRISKKKAFLLFVLIFLSALLLQAFSFSVAGV